MQPYAAAQVCGHPGFGVGQPQLRRSGGRAQVTTQPYYAAEDIGIGGQGACAQGGCFFGVMHYIYKVAPCAGRSPPAWWLAWLPYVFAGSPRRLAALGASALHEPSRKQLLHKTINDARANKAVPQCSCRALGSRACAEQGEAPLLALTLRILVLPSQWGSGHAYAQGLRASQCHTGCAARDHTLPPASG